MIAETGKYADQAYPAAADAAVPARFLRASEWFLWRRAHSMSRAMTLAGRQATFRAVRSGHKLATAGSESKEASVGKLLRGQETSVAGAGSHRRPWGRDRSADLGVMKAPLVVMNAPLGFWSL